MQMQMKTKTKTKTKVKKTNMVLRDWHEVSKEEMSHMIANTTQYVVAWMEHFGIRAGSAPQYNLYRAVQEAFRSEWERGQRYKNPWELGGVDNPYPDLDDHDHLDDHDDLDDDAERGVYTNSPA
jgi:hypothetical protein